MLETPFDTSEYAWKDLEVAIMGRPLVRILNVKYEASQALEEIYGRGQNPLGIQEGNYQFKGEIVIGQSELIALQRKAKELGFKNILKLRFDINIVYNLDGIVTRNVCKGARIEKFEEAMKQGDTAMEITLPFKFTDIQYGL
ncbi:MAG: hypothetical protein RL135_1541 [Bacteroidota bacterium]|jgi:hypothetical protein